MLSVLGADDAGESNLTYSWSCNNSVSYTRPSGQTYTNGSNGASTLIATFSATGTYVFTVTITDQGRLFVNNSSSPVSVTVTQVLTTITGISMSPATAQAGGPTTTFSATATDQFNKPISSPAFSWGVTAGRITNAGVFTPPKISEPCLVTVGAPSGSGGTSLTQAVAITASPLTGGRLGDDWIEPLFEQALGSPAAGHLNQLTNGTQGASLPSLPGWTPGSAFPSVPTQGTSRTTPTPRSSSSTSWTVGNTTYTAVETDWSTDTLQVFLYSGGGWNYNETATWNYSIDTERRPRADQRLGLLDLHAGGHGRQLPVAVRVLRHGLRHRRRKVCRRRLEPNDHQHRLDPLFQRVCNRFGLRHDDFELHLQPALFRRHVGTADQRQPAPND